MTKEEAKQILSIWLVSSKGAKGQRGYIEGWFDEEDAEAFRMAIEALSADIVKCKDCRYCTEYYDRDGYPYWECSEWDGGTDADGFCHYGESKEEINGFKSVGQAWNTSQGRWEK